MQQRATKIGQNRTGIAMSPEGSKAMLEAIDRFQSTEATVDQAAPAPAPAQLRYEQAVDADAIGSVPPPPGLRGLVSTGIQQVAGRNPEVLLDKLAERLAFERAGVRLYDAFLVKCRAAGETLSIPVEDVQHIRNEELAHFALLDQAITGLGADPTAQTPCADATAVMSMGIVQLMSDPRTSLPQAMEALLTIELVDNASWDLLIDLARASGQDALVPRFEEARTHEAEHLHKVRGWLRKDILDAAG
jgi:hypothetical protein